MNQLQANNIESAFYYSDHNFAYLTTKVWIPIGENQQASLVRVSDPEFTLTSEFEAAGVPWSVADDSPTLWILCFGTALIVAMGCIGRVIIAQRRNRRI
ncbi:hypothetical protein FYK55_00510 [Roseiconus nitratireducens]|uniref:Uncharacterized protein n=1 Tax=Roseiconus nitratireducens TaxID=2605748 RepID=A0A5M6DHE1_9BACT|nr:hypothetical protein [Roseiconus nitratireducens]KAA5546941.1 hypothetical protein FYK55_00510 [Roseiconus nitratireducens]